MQSIRKLQHSNKSIYMYKNNSFNQFTSKIKEYSIFGTLLITIIPLYLYFSGIATYSMHQAFYGIEPFEYGLKCCFERGAFSVINLIIMVPILIIGSLQLVTNDIFKTSLFLAILPLIIFFAHSLMQKSKNVVVLKSGQFIYYISHIVNILVLIVIYFYLIAIMAVLFNILFKPDINYYLDNSHLFNLSHFKTYPFDQKIICLLIGKDNNGAAFFSSAVFLLSLLTFISCSVSLYKIFKYKIGIQSPIKVLAIINKTFYSILICIYVFTLTFELFIVPSTIELLCGMSMLPRVEVAIDGDDKLINDTYFYQIGEFNDYWQLYSPLSKNIIKIKKDKIKYLKQNGLYSLYADRARFVKKGWIGVTYNLNFALKLGHRIT